ncbi:MAG: TerC family protein [Deltaproteobacteria bacterium]|nr:TerC family protein [Deltaproteobacteria bacterium]
MSSLPWSWIAFCLFVLAMLALDLGVLHRRPRKLKIREALGWSVVWISLALCFDLGLYLWQGVEPAAQFLAGYLIEKSLSVDNLFVFLLIFAYFKVPDRLQQRALAWGILGALLLRGTMIGAGAYLIRHFHWVLYVFGAFLVYTGFRIAFGKEAGVDPERNPVLRAFRRLARITPSFEGARLVVRRDGRLWATPLFVVVLVIETSDIVFAVDSIPAIFAVSTDAFIVFTSNVFAILGLRALYFALAGVAGMFHYLKYGLGVVLAFVGTKMLVAGIFKIPTFVALMLVVLVLLVSIGVSLHWPPGRDRQPESEPES